MKDLGLNEILIKNVMELANEAKIPVIDGNVYEKFKAKTKNALVEVDFEFKEDLDLIRSFIGLADYFKTLIIEDEDEFYIPHENMIFILSG